MLQAEKETPIETPEEYEIRLREVTEQKFKIKKELEHIQKLIEKRNYLIADHRIMTVKSLALKILSRFRDTQVSLLVLKATTSMNVKLLDDALKKIYTLVDV